jgi:hypothetical protein
MAGGHADGSPAALAPLAHALGQLEALAPQLSSLSQSCSKAMSGVGVLSPSASLLPFPPDAFCALH